MGVFGDCPLCWTADLEHEEWEKQVIKRGETLPLHSMSGS